MSLRTTINSHEFQSPMRKTGKYYAYQTHSRLYNKSVSRPQTDWIGKYFIPIGSFPRDPYYHNYVSENEVIKKTGRYAYRIIYTNGIGMSKPSIEYRPAQLNIILSPDNVILDAAYF